MAPRSASTPSSSARPARWRCSPPAHFRDVLELARLKIPNMYDLLSKRPAPLITRDRVFGSTSGCRPTAPRSAARRGQRAGGAARRRSRPGAEGVVIALLHSYRNPAHERGAGRPERVGARPAGVLLERGLADHPRIRAHHHRHHRRLCAAPRRALPAAPCNRRCSEAGVAAEPRLTKSNGGVMTAEQGKPTCVQMILSGTASGVIGASYIARWRASRLHEPRYRRHQRRCGLHRRRHSRNTASASMIGDFQIYIPSVSVTSIGEGGGSIAWVTVQGVLQVGPESAGSTPGPACYGRGGTRPTITDAFAACGLIGHGNSATTPSPSMWTRRARAVGDAGASLGRGVEQTAEAIIQIAVSGMYRRGQQLTSRFGIDPRGFALLAFGGAGPMLGCFLARELGMAAGAGPDRAGRAERARRADRRPEERFYQDGLLPARAAELPRLRRISQRCARRGAGLAAEEQGHRRPARAAALRRHALSGPILRDRDAAAAGLDHDRRLAAHRGRLPCASTTASTAMPTRRRRSIWSACAWSWSGTSPKPEFPAAPLRGAAPRR